MEHKILVAEEAGSGHACELALALRKYVNLTAVWEHTSAYGLDKLDPESKVGLHNLPKESDGIIIIGVGIFDRLYRYLKMKSKHKNYTIIVTDGGIMRDRNKYVQSFRTWNKFATLCKIQFLPGAREYYQPFNINIPIKKDKNLLVGHSPFGKSKWREKGTEQIIEQCDYPLDLITQVPWAKSLERKAKCHIFVDQIDHFDGHKFGWRGGIGKSGYEAMLLDCLVISRGKFVGDEIPAPPIAWCTKENYKEVLDYYAYNHKERNEKIQAQKDWADKYLKPDFHAKRILQIQ